MKKLKSILITGVIFAMIFTVFPSIMGDANVYAATPKKITLNVTGYTNYTTTLKWNKCKSPKKGYAVFVDGSCVKRFNTKTTSYSYSSSPGNTHAYQIKVWTSKKQYYNTKKKKWVNSKPKASQWKGKQTRYKYTYSKASNTRTVTNPKLNQTIYAKGSQVSGTANQTFNLEAYSDSGLGLTYSSSNTGIATVDANGNVTTKSAGTTTITITQKGTSKYNSASKTVKVTVTGLSQTITHYGNKTLNKGDKYRIGGSASSGLPISSYTSSNTNVATVDSTGLVTAKNSGSTTITIRQNGNGVYSAAEAYATIKVNYADITIHYDGNGATSGSMTDQVISKGKGTLKANTFTKGTWIFKGWNTDRNATTARWADKATFEQYGNDPITVTLYAIWERPAEPEVISGPFTVSYPYQNGTTNVIDINKGEVEVPLTIPAHVARIEWKTVKVGLSDSSNTISYRTDTTGKKLYLTANNALNSDGYYGKLKYVGTLTMENGYTYNGTPEVSFTVTNTVYPMVGSISDQTYDFKSFNRDIANADVRSLYVFKELPNNSTININLEEFYAGYDNIKLFLPTNNWEIINKKSVVGKIISPISYNGQIRLYKAGTFQMYFPETNRTMTFVLTGNASDYIQSYYSHLNTVANYCKTSDEITTIKRCLAYIFAYYTYQQGNSNMWTDGVGNCASGNQYLTDLLNVCGIEAYFRNASIERANHYNTAIILSDNTTYIADGTPDVNASSIEDALNYINETINQHSGRHSRLISWDEYDAYYDAVVIQFLW